MVQTAAWSLPHPAWYKAVHISSRRNVPLYGFSILLPIPEYVPSLLTSYHTKLLSHRYNKPPHENLAQPALESFPNDQYGHVSATHSQYLPATPESHSFHTYLRPAPYHNPQVSYNRLLQVMYKIP